MNTLKLIKLDDHKQAKHKQHMDNIMDRFISTYSNNKSNITLKHYTRHIKKFFNVDELSQITYEMVSSKRSKDVMDVIDKQLKKKSSRGNIDQIRCALSSFYKTCIEYSEEVDSHLHKSELMNLFTINPANATYIKSRIKRTCDKRTKKSQMEIGEVLNMTHAKSYIQAITEMDSEKQQARNINIVLLGAMAGLRRCEMLHLQPNNIKNFHKDGEDIKCLEILDSKGSNSRMVDISDYLYEKLNDYIINYYLAEDDYIIGTLRDDNKMSDSAINKQMDRYAESVEKVLTIHQFRNIFAGELVKAKVDTRDIMQLLGHSSVLTTEGYLRDCGLEIKRTNKIVVDF